MPNLFRVAGATRLALCSDFLLYSHLLRRRKHWTIIIGKAKETDILKNLELSMQKEQTFPKKRKMRFWIFCWKTIEKVNALESENSSTSASVFTSKVGVFIRFRNYEDIRGITSVYDLAAGYGEWCWRLNTHAFTSFSGAKRSANVTYLIF